MSKPLAPCKDCPDREVGCHSKCERYTSFRKELDEYNKAEAEDMIKKFGRVRFKSCEGWSSIK